MQCRINFENYALEVIRSAVPFDVLSFSYSSEIDLDGHPIPAKVVFHSHIYKHFTCCNSYWKLLDTHYCINQKLTVR